MLTDRQFPDPTSPATNPHSDLAHPMPPAGRTHDERPYIYALTVVDTARRYVKLLAPDAADEFLMIVADMFPRLNPAPAPARVQTDPADAAVSCCGAENADDAESVFPGIFHGRQAGDFAGLPPAPARVPADLETRLRGMAEELNETLRCFNRAKALHLVTGVRAKLHALADKVAAEGGGH